MSALRDATSQEILLSGFLVPVGHKLVVDQRDNWRVLTDEERDRGRFRGCRRPSCHGEPVAALNRGLRLHGNRGRRPSWWAYCAEHLYGGWIEDGRVVGVTLRSLEDGAA